MKLTYPRGKRKFELHKSDINAIHKARILCASFVECGEVAWQNVVDAIDARIDPPATQLALFPTEEEGGSE